jgi:transcriptional regulator with XRE-family HTH domain
MPKQDSTRDPASREERLVQERFLLLAQTEIQRLLNDKGLKYRDLALRLRVSEARVSQMFGDEAANLTIRTIARIFHTLEESPVLMSERAFKARLAEARGVTEGAWRLAGVNEHMSVSATTEIVEDIAIPREVVRSNASKRDWALADAAAQLRRVA